MNSRRRRQRRWEEEQKMLYRQKETTPVPATPIATVNMKTADVIRRISLELNKAQARRHNVTDIVDTQEQRYADRMDYYRERHAKWEASRDLAIEEQMKETRLVSKWFGLKKYKRNYSLEEATEIVADGECNEPDEPGLFYRTSVMNEYSYMLTPDETCHRLHELRSMANLSADGFISLSDNDIKILGVFEKEDETDI